MRISNMMSSTLMNANLTHTLDRMLKLQNQASSGMRMTRASDDPVGANQALNLRATVAGIGQFKRNVDQARTQMALMDSGLGNITKAIQEANRLGLSGANGTTDNAQRQNMALQVQQQIDGILREVNVTHLNRHIYSGHKTADVPVAINPMGTPPYTYNGDDGAMKVMVNDSTEVQVNLTAREILNMGSTDPAKPDVLTALVNLRDGLNAGDVSKIEASLKDLDKGSQNVIAMRGQVGARGMQMEVYASQLDESKVTMSAWLSEIEGVDIAETITRLQTEQNAYQAALIAMGRMTQSSLADYLR